MGIFKFFKKHQKQNTSLKEKINNQIELCNKNIIKYEQDIYRFEKNLSQLLHKIFFIPEKYWYEEIKNLDKILSLPENQNIDLQTKEQTLELIKQLEKLINLRKKKIQICKKTIDKLQDLLKKQDEIRKKIELAKKRNTEIKNLYKKLNSILQKEEISYIQGETEQMELQIKELEDDFKLIEEENKQLLMLYAKYSDKNNIEDLLIFEEELLKFLEDEE